MYMICSGSVLYASPFVDNDSKLVSVSSVTCMIQVMSATQIDTCIKSINA